MNCDVQAQSVPAKSNKISGDAIPFRAGGLFDFKQMGSLFSQVPEKLIFPD